MIDFREVRPVGEFQRELKECVGKLKEKKPTL